MPAFSRRALALLVTVLCLAGCGGGSGSPVGTDASSLAAPTSSGVAPVTPARTAAPRASKKVTWHEAQFARDPALRANLLGERVVTHLETHGAASSATDTATAGVDRIPIHLAADTTFSVRLSSEAVRSAAVLAADGAPLAALGSGQKLSLAAGDYIVELSSRDAADALVFVSASGTAAATPVLEITSSPQAAAGASTAVTAFVGYTASGPAGPYAVSSWTDYVSSFGGLDPASPLSYAVWQFFQNGGSEAYVMRTSTAGTADLVTACDGLRKTFFNLIVLPDLPALTAADATPVRTRALALATQARAFCIFDPPAGISTVADLIAWRKAQPELTTPYAAVYFPRIQVLDPLTHAPTYLSPAGAMAGLYAASDAARGVWNAPAGENVAPVGAIGLETLVYDADNLKMSAVGLNAIRQFVVVGIVCWGARSIGGSGDFQYLQVLRLEQYIENSLWQALQWVVFEPDTPLLWQGITQDCSAFLQQLWAAGGLFGATAGAAYTVTCDATTNPPSQVLLGQVFATVQFAAVHPAEFIVVDLAAPTASAPSP